MTNQSGAAYIMIQKQLKELDQIFQETMETLNTVAGAERMAKWKARTSALITESLGQKEGLKFAALQPGPSLPMTSWRNLPISPTISKSRLRTWPNSWRKQPLLLPRETDLCPSLTFLRRTNGLAKTF